MRPRWFLVTALAALVVGTVIGWGLQPGGGSSAATGDVPTTTTHPSTTTAPPVVLTSTAVLSDALQAASHRLTGLGASGDDVRGFVAGYHQDELAHRAADPPTAADAYVRLHHPAEVAAYGYVRQAECFGQRLLPGGADDACDSTTVP